MQDGAARADGEVVEVDLQPDLPDGTYVVSYRVVSADGHPVRGGSVFGVGDGEVDTRRAGPRGGRRRRPDVGGGRRRRPGPRLRRGPARRRRGRVPGARAPRRGAERGALVAVGPDQRGRRRASASLVALPVQAALGTGQGPGSLFDAGVLAEVAKDGVGLGVVLAIVGLVVACRRPRAAGRSLALVGAAVAAGSFATNGHTRAGLERRAGDRRRPLPPWVAAVWGGGLVLLWRTLRARRGEDDRADTVVAGRSVLRPRHGRRSCSSASPAASLAWERGAAPSTPSPARATAGCSSPRSRWSAVIAALGAYNHFRLVPALTPRARPPPRSPSSGPRVRIEALPLVAGRGDHRRCSWS